MKINYEERTIFINNKKINIPQQVINLLKDDSSTTEEHLEIANNFLNDINANRIGFNGLNIDNYYEFIFRIDGETFFDTHTDKYEIKLTVDNVNVRIGTITDAAILVISCKSPFLKNYYIENEMFHYLTISFNSNEHLVNKVLQHTRSIINSAFSKNKSYIIPDDVFKPTNDDDLDELLETNSLTDAISSLKNLDKTNHISREDQKLFELIANSYQVEEKKRFIVYFRILEYISRKQKYRPGKSAFSTYYYNLNNTIKNKTIEALDEKISFNEMIEYIRNLRNLMIHPVYKIPVNIKRFPMREVVKFQKELIHQLTRYKL